MKAAEIQLKYKNNVKKENRFTITTSKDAETFLRSIYNNDTIEYIESFFVLLLNRANEVLGYKEISIGGVSSCIVDPKVIFQCALLTNASAIILSHNHPSGSLKASNADRQITNKIQEIGNLVDINLLDHIIMTNENSFSFADNGLI